MDIQFYLQEFESHMSSYAGDDPLDAWDKFVDFLDPRLPPEEKCKISVVLERLVNTFLQDKRYHNDLRFINHCIRCASHHPDPVTVYSHVHSNGVGLQTADLYISWAQQCERRNLNTQAEQVYRRALECRAEPVDTLEHHYRLFQSRTGTTQKTPSVTDAVSTPLQCSQRDNIQTQREDEENSACAAVRTIRTISRSENKPPPNRTETQCVSMYCVAELVCEGSELSFEELRARRYFTRIKQQELQRKQEEALRRAEKEEEEVVRLRRMLEDLNRQLSDEPCLQQVTSGSNSIQSTEDTPSPAVQTQPFSVPCVPEPFLTHHTDTSLAQRTQHTHRANLTDLLDPRHESVHVSREEPPTGAEYHVQRQERDGVVRDEDDGDVNSDVSYGGLNHSRVTPNTSLGLISMTPARALPSPTVNTREALDLIGNMFQGPTLLQDLLFNSTHNAIVEEDSFERNCKVTASSAKTPSSVPFRIYQDENNENKSMDPQTVVKPKPAALRALMEVPVSKANVTPQVESRTEDSSMWASGHTHMASLPNRTQDFALSAHLASTPLHQVAPYSWDTLQSQVESGAEDNPYLRKPPKLSPILEQSPPEESQHGGAKHNQNTTLVSSQVFAPTSFPNQSITSFDDLRAKSKPSWSIYQSPDKEVKESQVGSVRDCNSNMEFNSSNLDLVREHKPEQAALNPTSLQCNSSVLRQPDLFNSSSLTSLKDQFKSNTLQCNSNTELDSCSQNPFPVTLPDQLNSKEDFNSSRLRLLGEVRPEKLNSSKLSIFEEMEPDQVNLNYPQLSDLEEADILLPERSFNMTKSVTLLLEMHQRKSIMFPQSPDPVSRMSQDVPMSPETAPGFDWLQVDSPLQPAEPDLDVMKSPPPQTSRPGWNVHSDQHSSMVLERKSEKALFQGFSTAEKSVCGSPSRGQVLGLNWMCSESPMRVTEAFQDVVMTPQQNNKTCTMGNGLDMSQGLSCDVPMSPTSVPPTSSVLISNPWDDDVIASLLAGLRIPLTSYPNLSTWSCCVPSISPKLTLQMGDVCVRVDRVVGQGAFATVYQATELDTSHKIILKVQKPSNPWEFYINAQLNARVEPRARHLYNRLHGAHLYGNGSVLLGELHSCGTLLNAVNLYKSRSEKVMPQPLVLYFTICILDMVERLHAARIIHADIKPDNFLLGESFLENTNLSEENLEHGLVLIDFGQSIDMTLFPDGAQFTAHCMTSGFQCTEMLSSRPWTYQTDYFGVAGTVYCMLFGSYMQVRNEGGVWKTGGVFKRNPHSDLWQEFFHVLLNIPDCSSLPCLHALRERLCATLLDNYSTKLLGLKNRLVVQILESRSSRK